MIVGEIGKRVLHAVAGFEQHQRRIDARELGEARAPRAVPSPAKTPRRKSGRSAAPRPSAPPAPTTARARAITAMAGGAGLAHQLEAGIGDQRRAGVRDQRDRGALRQPLQDLRPRRRGVVLVIGRQLRRDREALGQARA